MSSDTRAEKPMMKCGHVASAVRVDGDVRTPICPICGADGAIIDTAAPSMHGRRARCAYYGKTVRHDGRRGSNECNACRTAKVCQCERDSDPQTLAFFAYRGPDTKHYKGPAPFDEFYCGCMGWD